MKAFASPILWLIIGAAAFYALSPGPREIIYPEVIVHRSVIEAQEPDTVMRWRERIVTRIVQAEQVATAPGGAESDVGAFCADTIIRVDTVQGGVDTVRVAPDPRLLIRSFSLDESWFFRSDHLTVTGPLSSGDLRQFNYRTRGDVSARANGDSLIIRSDRWAFLKDALQCSACASVGYATCKIR
jgi:hypothetical protein